MSLNFTNLVSQGRAKAHGVPWSEVELEALITLENERGIGRLKAADYIRNGILTLEDYDKAISVDFVPKTREEAEKEVDATLKAHGEAAVSSADKAQKGKKLKKSDE